MRTTKYEDNKGTQQQKTKTTKEEDNKGTGQQNTKTIKVHDNKTQRQSKGEVGKKIKWSKGKHNKR